MQKIFISLLTVLFLWGCTAPTPPPAKVVVVKEEPTDQISEQAKLLIESARAWVGKTRFYDLQYYNISFPMGDVPSHLGACTDVVIRAYRDAFDYDLQELVFNDIKADYQPYFPVRGGAKHPDPNIDHRRTANLEIFFRKHAEELPIPSDPTGYRPGDLVTWRISGAEPHIGIVSDRIDEKSGRHLLIHNIGKGAVEEDFLWVKGVVGRFKLEPNKPEPVPEPVIEAPKEAIAQAPAADVNIVRTFTRSKPKPTNVER